jgi:integrase
MPRKATEFTETYIKSLEAGDKVFTKSERSLIIRVYPSGVKAWSYYKTAPNSARKEVKMGNYPDISLKDARDIAQKLGGQMIKEGHGIETNKKGVKFGEYLSDKSYLNWSRVNRKAHKTIMQNLQNVVPVWMHRKPLNTFSNADFQKFVDGRLKEGVKPQTINRNLNNIRSVFKRAYLEGVITENPMVRFQQLKVKETNEKRSLTDDERKRLVLTARDKSLEQAYKRDYMEFFIELGLQTGLRKGELLALKWKHFKNDFLKTVTLDTGQRIQVIEREIVSMKIDNRDKKKLPEIEYKNELKWYIEVEGTFTKSGKNRTVPVPDELIDRIRKYLFTRELISLTEKHPKTMSFDENLNLIQEKGKTLMGVCNELPIIPVKDPKKAFNTIRQEAGLEPGISIHTMRHDYCTRLIKDNVDIYHVQRLAGHQDIRTTMNYLHSLDTKDFTKLNELEHNLIGD